MSPSRSPAHDLRSAAQRAARAEQAAALQRAVANRGTALLLRGKKLALICDSASTPRAWLFREAAQALGMHVAHLQSRWLWDSEPQDVQRTAQLLGRLYDALACDDLPAALAAQLRRDAGVPVFDGLVVRGERSKSGPVPLRFLIQADLIAALT